MSQIIITLTDDSSGMVDIELRATDYNPNSPSCKMAKQITDHFEMVLISNSLLINTQHPGVMH